MRAIRSPARGGLVLAWLAWLPEAGFVSAPFRVARCCRDISRGCSSWADVSLLATPFPAETTAYRQPLFRCMSDPGYRSQNDVESGFRQLKDPHVVGFSPMFHWTEAKIRVHVFYCVLALALAVAHLMRRQAHQAGLDLSVRVECSRFFGHPN